MPKDHGPGLDLLKEFVDHIASPSNSKAGVFEPEELTRAFNLGAYAVTLVLPLPAAIDY